MAGNKPEGNTMAGKTEIAVIGAGKIGETIAALLLASTD